MKTLKKLERHNYIQLLLTAAILIACAYCMITEGIEL